MVVYAMRLTQHPAFDGLDPKNLRLDLVLIKTSTVQTGELLSGPGLRPVRLHFVLEGELACFQLTADGKRLLMEILEPGALDGLLMVAGLNGHFTEARKRSVVASLTSSEVSRLTSREPLFAANLLRLTLQRLEKREDQLDSLAHREPGRRLARQLLALGGYLGEQENGRMVLRPRLSHQTLADMLGLRRETVTLHVNLLATLGAVRVQKGAIALDQRVLQDLVDGSRPLPQRGRYRQHPKAGC